MTAPLREQHINDGITALNGAINNSVTSITVVSGGVFPSAGNFRIMIDSEIMICTARSSNTLTVTRGQDGTAAASHSDAAAVNMMYSQQSLTRMFQDNDPLFGYSSVLPHGLYNDAGTALLTTSDFTWLNQGGATVTDESGSVLMKVPTDSGNETRGQELTITGSNVYITAMNAWFPGTDTDAKPSFGMYFRETSSSKLMVLSVLIESFFSWEPSISVSRFSAPGTQFTVNDGPRKLQLISDRVWLKAEVDGSNIKFSVSPDGVTWLLYFTESKTAYFSSGPDRIGWFGRNNGNSGTGAFEGHVRLHHWSKG